MLKMNIKLKTIRTDLLIPLKFGLGRWNFCTIVRFTI